MTEIEYTSHGLEETRRLGETLAKCLPERITLALRGTLGAGKTNLVQAIAAACGVDPTEVTSPTFVLCQHYRGDRQINHLDAYRIADEDEFFELGVDEYFESDGITIVEWADRVSACLPRQYLQIEIDIVGETERQITLTAVGVESVEWMERLQTELED